MAPTPYTVITLDKSDGAPATHPTNTTKPAAPGPDGQWDYFRPVVHDEAKDFLWRSKCAAALVDKYAGADEQLRGRHYLFATMPEGYALFEHIKGKADGNLRKDTYLFGHPGGGRFRSPAEFMPHVYHLASQSPGNSGSSAAAEHALCTCRLCGVAGPARTPGSARRAAGGDGDAPAGTAAVAALARRELCAEERLGEQEMVGWVLRKGEVVWVWTGPEEVLADLAASRGSEHWAAAVVADKPATNPPFRAPPAPPPRGTFADIEMADAAPWPEPAAGAGAAATTYSLQLCADGAEGGAKLAGIAQHLVRPWLARPAAAGVGPPANASVAAARAIVDAVSVFERTRTTTAPDASRPATLYNGLFLGPEKFFVGDPVRIAAAGGGEDVLVIDHVYVSTGSQSPGGSGGKTAGAGTTSSTSSNICVSGSVYHLSGAQPLTPEQFAQLPWRMRRLDPDTGATLAWSIRNAPAQRGECSIRLILGRWYEPAAVAYWLAAPPAHTHAATRLGRCAVRRWVRSRADALGWAEFNGVILRSPPPPLLLRDEDRRAAVRAEPAGTAARATAVRASATPVRASATPVRASATPVRATPDRGFVSVNAPGSAGTSRMARAVAEDMDDAEPDAEHEPAPAPGAASPSRRLSFRPK